ncbi:hypothetical protein ACFZBM_39360 [Streptomyces lavendulae]|uniref:Uncharacterized protein n=1 Tax=Streptomyces lavendulae subsp. lavendulae TaxID=58340 RepID=A0A2K8PTN9_STRLA|nr:hypothetical protein [Streptomyces lavendulae]ATZ22071.1 hypothetical protein SLAV_00705 [Streptomyces lavendulae subsp. lavendulae]ATZ29500.1 hypothetical protein SLAV_38685 [Streptomyces lavendulae subsp. lavendulae]
MIGQDVDDVAARDHIGGGEVFEGLPLGGVAGGDSAADPDPQENLCFEGLDRAADGCVRLRPAGDGAGLVGPEDVEPRGGGVPVGRSRARPTSTTSLTVANMAS